MFWGSFVWMWVTRVTKRVEISFRLLLYLAAERQILFFLPSHYFSFFFLLVLQYSTLLLLVLLDDIDQPKSTQCRLVLLQTAIMPFSSLTNPGLLWDPHLWPRWSCRWSIVYSWASTIQARLRLRLLTKHPPYPACLQTLTGLYPWVPPLQA